MGRVGDANLSKFGMNPFAIIAACILALLIARPGVARVSEFSCGLHASCCCESHSSETSGDDTPCLCASEPMAPVTKAALPAAAPVMAISPVWEWLSFVRRDDIAPSMVFPVESFHEPPMVPRAELMVWTI